MMSKRVKPKNGLGLLEGSTSDSTTLQTGLGSTENFLPFFQYVLTPKNTTIEAYQSTMLSVPISQIHRVWIEYPSGCVGLVGLQIWRAVEQIFPLPSGVWLRSNGYTFAFNFTHTIDKEPYEIEFRTYNLDDTFSHTIWIGLELRGLPTEPSPQLQAFMKTLQ